MKLRVFYGVNHFIREMLVFHGRPAVGADIYLRSEYEKREKMFELDEKRMALDNARTKQDSDPAEVKKLADAWEEALLKVEEGAYYRDSYNASNLAWLVGLSYWEENENLDDDGNLRVERAAHWLNTLQMADMRKIVREAMDNAAANAKERKGPLDDGRRKPELELGPDETYENVVDYFERKRQRFMLLLTKSIELREPLEWSV